MQTMSGYVKTFKVHKEDNKLMSFCLDHEKLLEKYKAICTKIENSKNIELNALSVHDDRYIKTKIRTCGENVYTNFLWHKCARRWYRIWIFYISIDSLLVYKNKYYLQVYLDNCAYKTVNKQITDYLKENLFGD